MSFRTTFKNRHVVLPVIHAESSEQVFRNAELALRAGVDGIWLINHEIPWEDLLRIHQELRAAQPTAWIGLNFLELTPYEGVVLSSPPYGAGVSGLWSDQAYIQEEADIKNQPAANRFLVEKRARAWSGLYFGGVAMKGQRKVEDLESAAKVARHFMDVVCTSGRGTGVQTPLEKVQRLYTALEGFPLAIASGVTPENVKEYLPFVDAFLVATGVSSSFTELDETLLKKLLENVHG